MGQSKRKDFEDFCELPILFPKDCLPLLTKLKEKIEGCGRDNQKAKGWIILIALQFMDQQTPYGWWAGEHLRLFPVIHLKR